MGNTKWKAWHLIALICWGLGLAIIATNVIVGLVRLATHTMNYSSEAFLTQAILSWVACVFVLAGVAVLLVGLFNSSLKPMLNFYLFYLKPVREKKNHRVEEKNTTQG